MRKILSLATIFTGLLVIEGQAKRLPLLDAFIEEGSSISRSKQKSVTALTEDKQSERQNNVLSHITEFLQKFGANPKNSNDPQALKDALSYVKQYRLMESSLFRGIISKQYYAYPAFEREAKRGLKMEHKKHYNQQLRNLGKERDLSLLRSSLSPSLNTRSLQMSTIRQKSVDKDRIIALRMQIQGRIQVLQEQLTRDGHALRQRHLKK